MMEKWQKETYDKEDGESLLRTMMSLRNVSTVMERKLSEAQSKQLEYEVRLKEAQADVDYYVREVREAREQVDEFESYLEDRLSGTNK